MPLTAAEVNQKIEVFLEQVYEKYVEKTKQSVVVKSLVEQNKVKEKFRKLIFCDFQDYTKALTSLEPTELTLEVQQLRLLRMGVELDLSNTSKYHVSLDCFKELSQVLSINGCSKEVEYRLGYVALAYHLSNGGKEREALDYFLRVRDIFKKGGFLPFNVLDPEFLRLYYSFCIILTSWRTKNCNVHTSYDDFPYSKRIGNIDFESAISEAVRFLSSMPWLKLQAKIAIVTAYQVVSAKCYETISFCDLSYLTKAVNYAKQSVEESMLGKNLVAASYKYGDSKEARERACREIMANLFPSLAAEQEATRTQQEAFITSAKQRLAYLDKFLIDSTKQYEQCRVEANKQAIDAINSWTADAKKEANQRSFENFKLKCAVAAATNVLAPYVAPSIAPVVSSAIGSLGVSAVTSSTVGAVLAPAIAKAAISTALSAAVEGDYSHFGKNITKSLATNVITAAASLASISEPSSSLTDGIKQPVIDAAKGAMESLVRGENILKGTFISVASGAVSGKCLEALPIEVKEVSAVQAAVSTVVSSAVGAMVKKEKDKSLIDSLHEGAETFIINQVGEAAARAVDGLTVEKKKDNEKENGYEFAANIDRQRQQEISVRKNVEKQKAAELKQTEQTKTNKPKPVQGKKVTTEQEKSAAKQSNRNEHRQAINAAWLDQAGLFNNVLQFSKQTVKPGDKTSTEDHQSSQTAQQQSSVATKAGNPVADFFMTAAYADEPQDKMLSTSNGASAASIPSKRTEGEYGIGRQRFKENYVKVTIDSDTLDTDMYSEQSKEMLNAYKTVAIGSGRGAVKFLQTAKEAGLRLGENSGIIESGRTENYIKQVAAEKELYDNTPVGQSKLGKAAETGTGLYLSYVTAKTLGVIGQAVYSEYKSEKTLREAFRDGKYSGEFKKYKQQSIQELRKTISSHEKGIAKHKEWIKNPKLKYQDWDTKSQLEKNNGIHHWQEDIKRAQLYKEGAKRILNEKLSQSSPISPFVTSIGITGNSSIVLEQFKIDSIGSEDDSKQSNVPKPHTP